MAGAVGVALVVTPPAAVGQDRAAGPTVDRLAEEVRRLRLLAPVDLRVPARDSAATRVSDSGVVVGNAWDVTFGQRGFRWEDGTAVLLPDHGNGSSVRDVNERGQVLGHVGTPDHGQRMALWQPDGTMVELAVPPDSGGIAQDLDDRGRVAVDWHDWSDRTWHAAVWQDGTLTLLDDRGGDSDVAPYGALNDRGEVAGTVRAGGTVRAVVWRDGTAWDLPVPEGAESWSRAINERGDVLGVVHQDGGTRAVVWEGGRMRYLADDAQYQEFYDLNERGVAVGTVGTPGGRWRAAVSDRRGLTRLPTLGGPDGYGSAVDDRGIVVGTATRGPDLELHAAVWVLGVPVPLGERVDARPAVRSGASDIDERGRVAGSVTVEEDGTEETRAVLWHLVPRLPRG